MESSESLSAAVHDEFFDRPDFSSEESLKAQQVDDNRKHQQQQQRARAAREAPETGFELLLRSLRGHCCVPFGEMLNPSSAPRAEEQRAAASPNANPLMAASFMRDSDSSSSTSSSEEEEENPAAAESLRKSNTKQQARILARECGIDWSTLPNVYNIERRARTSVAVPLIRALQDGFSELTEEQKSVLALQWINKVIAGSRMDVNSLCGMLAVARDQLAKRATIEHALKAMPDCQSVELDKVVHASNLDGVGGEYRRMLEGFANRSLFLIVQKHRVVATYTSLQGELWQNAVLDVGCTQLRGPAVFYFENWQDSEQFIFSLFKYDGVARLITRPIVVTRILDRNAPAATEDNTLLTPSPEAEAEVMVEPSVVADDDDDEASPGESPYEGFDAAYAAMKHAAKPGVNPEEREFRLDPKTQQLQTDYGEESKKKRRPQRRP